MRKQKDHETDLEPARKSQEHNHAVIRNSGSDLGIDDVSKPIIKHSLDRVKMDYFCFMLGLEWNSFYRWS